MEIEKINESMACYLLSLIISLKKLGVPAFFYYFGATDTVEIMIYNQTWTGGESDPDIRLSFRVLRDIDKPGANEAKKIEDLIKKLSGENVAQEE